MTKQKVAPKLPPAMGTPGWGLTAVLQYCMSEASIAAVLSFRKATCNMVLLVQECLRVVICD